MLVALRLASKLFYVNINLQTVTGHVYLLLQ